MNDSGQDSNYYFRARPVDDAAADKWPAWDDTLATWLRSNVHCIVSGDQGAGKSYRRISAQRASSFTHDLLLVNYYFAKTTSAWESHQTGIASCVANEMVFKVSEEVIVEGIRENLASQSLFQAGYEIGDHLLECFNPKPSKATYVPGERYKYRLKDDPHKTRFEHFSSQIDSARKHRASEGGLIRSDPLASIDEAMQISKRWKRIFLFVDNLDACAAGSADTQQQLAEALAQLLVRADELAKHNIYLKAFLPQVISGRIFPKLGKIAEQKEFPEDRPPKPIAYWELRHRQPPNDPSSHVSDVANKPTHPALAKKIEVELVAVFANHGGATAATSGLDKPTPVIWLMAGQPVAESVVESLRASWKGGEAGGEGSSDMPVDFKWISLKEVMSSESDQILLRAMQITQGDANALQTLQDASVKMCDSIRLKPAKSRCYVVDHFDLLRPPDGAESKASQVIKDTRMSQMVHYLIEPLLGLSGLPLVMIAVDRSAAQAEDKDAFRRLFGNETRPQLSAQRQVIIVPID